MSKQSDVHDVGPCSKAIMYAHEDVLPIASHVYENFWAAPVDWLVDDYGRGHVIASSSPRHRHVIHHIVCRCSQRRRHVTATSSPCHPPHSVPTASGPRL